MPHGAGDLTTNKGRPETRAYPSLSQTMGPPRPARRSGPDEETEEDQDKPDDGDQAGPLGMLPKDRHGH